MKSLGLREMLAELDRTIFVGDRLRANLKALTLVSGVTAVLSVVLLFIDIPQGDVAGTLCATLTLIASIGCGYSAGVLKRRRPAAIIPTVFCGIMFTIYAVTGLGNGQYVLWSLLMPIGVGYFVGVKYSIILCLYFTVLFSSLYLGPVREQFFGDFTQEFFVRFLLLFVSVSCFSEIALVQYHRSVLFEIDHTGRLNEEVDRQTRFARERAQRLEEMTDETVQMLAMAIDAKDRYTNGHSFRVSWYSSALARRIGLPEEELRVLEREALLHDIGKIGVPDSVLNKPGRLTDEEFEVIKSHTTVGGAILAASEGMTGASEVARHHHERYDGRGYPDGLAGEQIPFHARIVAIADAYDAMRSDRIYRKGLPLDVIHEELVKGKGAQFDPALLDVYLGLCEDGTLDEIAAREILLLEGTIPAAARAEAVPGLVQTVL